MIADLSDGLLYLALVTLPIDGTFAGIQLPYWTPIAPWFFLAYALVNWRYLRLTVRRFLPFFLFPLLLALTSVYGWQTIAVHPTALIKSFLSIVLALACLSSLDIAFRQKRLSWKSAVTVLVTTYWVAFATGILQYLAQGNHLNWYPVRAYFIDILYRRYIWVRPQFLFAEPSYIGMHLFGVLLPCYWVTRDRRLAVLVPVFAVGAIAMGSGTRIIIDSVVALFLWLIASVNFRNRKATWGFIGGMAVIGVGSVGAMFLNPRLNSLLTHGLLAGDGSMSARIFHALAPMWSWLHYPSRFLFGWGAGNIANAVKAGYAGARRWYDAHGGVVGWEIRSLANPPADTFTMSLYSSFITEFGILMFAVFLLMTLIHVTRYHAWNRVTIVWLVLLAYLYIQFESYAFYAIPLFIWAVSNQHERGKTNEITK
ncbi:hypothetical protein JS539_10390 [Bifidobacterium simiarum]|uniref:O-antigen polymerase n=1 Tax=Bifidobacterium simiarum TaxID=2045441 RepID=A0A2M9HDN9_9BIFI|nr:hypothetical protein [Bifidobacterium simiarum]PJM74922.1 hypothetical protein CSQ87_07800 [Bifidobacterium simiarum]